MNPSPSLDPLAVERTILAVERTLMAWVRTSLSLIGFGFSLIKFLFYMRQIAQNGDAAVMHQGPRNFGLTLIGLGTVLMILAAWQYAGSLRRLNRDFPARQRSLALLASFAVALLGIVAFLSILFNVGPFG